MHSSIYQSNIGFDQWWSGIVIFMMPFDNKDFTFFNTSRVRVFDCIVVVTTIQVYIPRKNLSI